MKIGGFLLRQMVRGHSQPARQQDLDHHIELKVSASEAAAGGEKLIDYTRSGQSKKLAVKIPRGVKNGTRIRLRRMGKETGGKAGDLYLHLRVT